MQDELKAIQKRVGTAFVHVTHDQEEAMALADHIVVMNHGRIEDQGPPERVYARPATRFAATFMGESTILPGRVDAAGRVATALGAFDAPGLAAGSTACIAIRPEHVHIGPGIASIVRDVVYQGSFKRVTATPASAPDIRLLARLPAGAAVSEGTEISLRFDPGEIIVLKD
ncbi:MAG TPA: ABC transporter ATP-binding protein [Dongiaceae bacterium]|nr:ABC transporter ATP-binding protein [Dongiaceae bacterium]